mmetsp:Transcript_37767/g.45946  ORF Transcript_37767/g.45946 Transcript_37767/m.45946 type:complete len:191 (-) Transcript_37767:2105-2677(-)
MDDPISALDAHVRKAIFDQVFVGLMKGKTRILVTHAIDFINQADHVIIMKDGKVEAQGSYKELESHPYILEVQDIHSKNKKEIEKDNILEALEETARRAKSSFDRRTSLVKSTRDLVPSGLKGISKFTRRVSVQATIGSFQPSTVNRSKMTRKPSVISEPVDLDELSDDELDDKLEDFLGPKKEIDQETN